MMVNLIDLIVESTLTYKQLNKKITAEFNVSEFKDKIQYHWELASTIKDRAISCFSALSLVSAFYAFVYASATHHYIKIISLLILLLSVITLIFTIRGFVSTPINYIPKDRDDYSRILLENNIASATSIHLAINFTFFLLLAALLLCTVLIIELLVDS